MAGSRSRTRGTTTSTTVGDVSTAVPGAEPAAEPAPAPAAPEAPTVGETAADRPAESEQPAGSTTGAETIAARRRAALSRTPAAHPPGAAAAGNPAEVIASRATVDAVAAEGSPVRPTGGVWTGMPVVLENVPGAAGGTRPGTSNYVVSEFDAVEATIPPGCKTPLSRRLWVAGQLVRRDVYAAVLAEHEQRIADGTAGQATPAQLPAHVTRMPPEAVAYGPDGRTQDMPTMTGVAGQAAPAPAPVVETAAVGEVLAETASPDPVSVPPTERAGLTP